MANKVQPKLKFFKGYGENFRSLREINGLTQKELSDSFHFSDSTIIEIEKERRLPTIEQLNLYVERFNVSLDYLTGRIKILEADNQLFCQKTGLTENSIKCIERIKESDISAVWILNQLLESGAILDICTIISDYYKQIEQAENGIDALTGQINKSILALEKLTPLLEPDEPAELEIVNSAMDNVSDYEEIKATLEAAKKHREETAQKYIAYELYDRLKEEIDKIINNQIP